VPRSAVAFAPATVANVTAGFDLLGFALDGPGDRVRAERSREPGVRLAGVDGDGGRLPKDAERNTAGVAAMHLLRAREEAGDETCGVVLHLEKGLPLASGLGSSAASSVAAAMAVDALFDEPSPTGRLLLAAMEGERVACGTAHADNAAPSLYGGMLLVRSGARVDRLAVDPAYRAAVIHPHVAMSTAEARGVLPERVLLADALTQAGNLAALVSALASGDDDLLASGLVDVLAEPARRDLVPGFPEAIEAAREAGALGGGLSGSGPSQFALVRGGELARQVVRRMADTVRTITGVEVDEFVSRPGGRGARVESVE
jgi:homoserine kinase